MRTSFLLLLIAPLLLAACQREQTPTEATAPTPAADTAAPASAPTTTPSSEPAAPAPAPSPAPGSVPVTADNYGRAASDLAFAGVVKDNGFGKFTHNRELTPLDKQIVVRQNRDTLYSSSVFDLDAGPVTITLPDPGTRFMSMQVFDEDQYTHQVIYKPGTYTLRKSDIGTRYVLAALRILVDPNNPDDVKAVHALQDAVTVSQPGGPGTFEVPQWDTVSLKNLTDALTVLGDTLPDKNNMFGMKKDVDPVRRLIGVATAWGGNPAKDATYLNFVPAKNDGTTIYHLDVKDVPVDGFWSVTVYDAKGFFQSNAQNAYSLNNVTAKKSDDGSVRIQFGGCDGQVPNCLPITPGWNYLVRLYRPRAEVLDGTWKFPEAVPAS
ncbi:DUF1254 domain-containing protein [Lysobacter sp. LF1]|uniref:DUF1254 domain-containing protein n=1 Tax=Lysobacter stagni TaxID=3045172 RepID=A0ABT6XKG1_9GAMM|nr:DUF1254 domain-containing protein [Lysobacter sp. LF1]MDI9240643.1 DUF1254 domain-containing protein [Lysobacter sp. LF1]